MLSEDCNEGVGVWFIHVSCNSADPCDFAITSIRTYHLLAPSLSLSLCLDCRCADILVVVDDEASYVYQVDRFHRMIDATVTSLVAIPSRPHMFFELEMPRRGVFNITVQSLCAPSSREQGIAADQANICRCSSMDSKESLLRRRSSRSRRASKAARLELREQRTLL